MNKVFVFVLTAGLMLTPMMVRAQQAAGDQAEVKAVEVGNKLCPVSGEEVGKMGPAVKLEHEGKIYNLCCAMCAKDFKNDPAKFAKKAEDEVAAAAAK